MTETSEYASFLVRVWRERQREDAPETATWNAEVESIQSGDSWRFANIPSLITFLEGAFLKLDHDIDR